MTARKYFLILPVLVFAVFTSIGPLSAYSQEPAAGPEGSTPDSGYSESPITADQPATDVQEIIRRFAAREAEFKQARENYTYRQVVKVQEVSAGGDVTGTHQIDTDIIFSSGGKRMERVVYAPLSTLRRISLSPEDERDLRRIQPFVLTTEDLPKYNVRYQGRQKVDDLDAYVFMISPKQYEKGERYFKGQVWVEDRDFQIVKSYGKAVPDIRSKNGENLFPRFETYRQQIDGKYWFPVWTGADDTLHFSSGAVRMRMIVRYENYKQFRSEINIKYGEEVPETPPTP